MPDATNTVSLPFLIVCRVSLSFSTIWDITSFFTRWTQLISILHQYSISQLWRHLWSVSRCLFFSTIH